MHFEGVHDGKHFVGLESSMTIEAGSVGGNYRVRAGKYMDEQVFCRKHLAVVAINGSTSIE